MDIPSNTLTMPQLILILSLFTLLIGWLVTFTYLAVRPMSEKSIEHTVTLPVSKTPVTQTLAITARASGIRTITQPIPTVTVSSNITREVVIEHSRH